MKETPSARDYCQFLQELHEESRGQPLNANELKAIIMVITSISQEGDKLLLEEKEEGWLVVCAGPGLSAAVKLKVPRKRR